MLWASEAGSTVIPLPPTSRRERMANGLLGAPVLPGVGQSEAFVKAFFETAAKAQQHGGPTDAPKEHLFGVTGVDRELALAIYKVDRYEPLTRDEYLADLQHPMLPVEIDLTMLTEARLENPLSLESLKKRLNYKGAEED